MLRAAVLLGKAQGGGPSATTPGPRHPPPHRAPLPSSFHPCISFPSGRPLSCPKAGHRVISSHLSMAFKASVRWPQPTISSSTTEQPQHPCLGACLGHRAFSHNGKNNSQQSPSTYYVLGSGPMAAYRHQLLSLGNLHKVTHQEIAQLLEV